MCSPENVRAPGLLLLIFILSGFSKLQIELEQMMLQCYTITASLWTSSNMPLFNVKIAQLFKCHFMFSKSHASTVE